MERVSACFLVGGVLVVAGSRQRRRPPSRELHDQPSRAHRAQRAASFAFITCSTSRRFRRFKSCMPPATGRRSACAPGRTRRARSSPTAFRFVANGAALPLQLERTSARTRPGAGGLPILYWTGDYTAPIPRAARFRCAISSTPIGVSAGKTSSCPASPTRPTRCARIRTR